MKKIVDHRKLLGVNEAAELVELKTVYRSLMKTWHPDKFQSNTEDKLAAEEKSKAIIEAYHFLVSISPETHASTLDAYTLTTSSSGIEDFLYKGQTLKITFQDGSKYEYFGVPKNTYNKLVSAPNIARFARRHIYDSFIYRNVFKPIKVEGGDQPS